MNALIIYKAGLTKYVAQDWFDIKDLCQEIATADEVHALPGWENSKAARLELQMAESLHKKIIYPLILPDEKQ